MKPEIRASLFKLLKDPLVLASIILVNIFFVLIGFYILTPLSLLVLMLFSIVFFYPFFKKDKNIHNTKNNQKTIPPILILFVFLPASLFTVLLYETQNFVDTIVRLIVQFSMATLFWYALLIIPLSIYRVAVDAADTQLEYFPSVSIIIPAYNEENIIDHTVNSMLQTDYPNKEIIVVNDGSTDNTLGIISKYQNIKIVNKPQGGKASAINSGLDASTGKIILIIDADTVVEKQAITNIVSPFEKNEKIGAVTGNVKVLNRNSILGRIQVLEYVVGIQMLRGVLGLFGMVVIVSGAFGAFRRDAILNGGSPFTSDTLTEDFDATLTMLERGYSVVYRNNAVAYTEVPETIQDYITQRTRWFRGFFQGYRKHAILFLSTKYGYSKNLAFFFMLNSHLILPIISLFNTIALIPVLVVGNWTLAYQIIALNFAMIFSYTLLGMRLDNNNLKYLLYYPLLFLHIRILDYVMVKSFLDEILKKDAKWGKLRRIGNKQDNKI